MRIAIFTDTFYPNTDGVAQSIINSTKILSRKGHKILIIAPDYRCNHEIKFNKNVTMVRIKSIPIPSYKDFRWVLPYYRKCLNETISFNPDLIHMQGYSTLGIMGIRIAKKLNLPLIGTYHTIAAEFVKYISPLVLINIEKLLDKVIPPEKYTRILAKQYWLSKKIIWKITIGLYNNCNIVITPSESIKRVLNEKGIRRKIITISNGINTGLFIPKKKYSKKIKKIIHVGRVSYEKNIDHTIKAFSLIAKKHKNIEYQIIGDGPALNFLKRLSKRLKLKDKITFSGKIPNNKLPKYYKKADIFITASTMETQGLVILEAMASGLPIVGVSKFAIPDIVKNGLNGFIVEPTDIKGMANYVDILVKNPKIVEFFGKNGAKIAKQHDLKKTVNKLEKTYKRLIKENLKSR